MMSYRTVSRLLVASGREEFKDAFTYQDYLYELYADGYNRDHPPISEKQWEYLCDMQGNRKLIYASTVKHALENVEKKADG